ncbi:hypothetical protein PAMP_010832 [Pampus punctatissimus]
MEGTVMQRERKSKNCRRNPKKQEVSNGRNCRKERRRMKGRRVRGERKEGRTELCLRPSVPVREEFWPSKTSHCKDTSAGMGGRQAVVRETKPVNSRRYVASFDVENTTKGDSGRYRCIAQSEQGVGVSSYADLTVKLSLSLPLSSSPPISPPLCVDAVYHRGPRCQWARWRLDKVAHPFLISKLMSWMTWGGVETTGWVSGTSLLACYTIFLTASAASLRRLCRSFVPVWITRHQGLLRVSFLNSFIAWHVVLQWLDSTFLPGKLLSWNFPLESASSSSG